MDVSIRLKLENQIHRNAEQAEKDLKELKKAAEQLGKSGAGSQLAEAIAKVEQNAKTAKKSIKEIGDSVKETKRAIGRVDDGSFDNLASDAEKSKKKIKEIASEAKKTKQAIGRVDDGAFDGLITDAERAERAIKDIGLAADKTNRKVRNVRGSGVGPHAPRGQFVGDTARAAFERSGADAYLPLGAGAAYMLGGATVGTGVVAGAAIRSSARDEFTSDQLMVLGEYSEKQQSKYDAMMRSIGARRGVGTDGANTVFGELMSGGLSHSDASQMTDGAIVFSKATGANNADAARTTIALRNNLGIGPNQMLSAYDAMSLGGKEGQFEVPDMARNFPSIAAKMAQLGEGGMPGVRNSVAISQAIRKGVGTSAEAATNFENLLDKITASDFVKNAKKLGINVEKTLTNAQANGQSPVLSMVDTIHNKVGSNPFKLSQLLPDRQARAALQAIIKDRQVIDEMIERMNNADGTVMNDFSVATDNASEAYDRFAANIAAKTKNIADGALPTLTTLMNTMSEIMETGDGSHQGITAPEGADKEALSNHQKATERGTRINRFLEKVLGREPSQASKDLNVLDGYKQYGKTRNQADGRERSDWSKFWFGDGGTSLKKSMAIQLRPEATKSMSGYNEALQSEGEKAKATADAIANQIKSSLNFNVSPTITPQYTPPPRGRGSYNNSSAQPTASVTQNIKTTNPTLAARRMVREQNRSIRMAKSGALHDIGVGTA